MNLVKKNLSLLGFAPLLLALGACNIGANVAAVNGGTQPTGTGGSCLVDRSAHLAVKDTVDCQDPAQYSCLSVDYSPDDVIASTTAPAEECVAGVFSQRICLQIKRLSDLESEEPHARDYNCFHRGIRLRGGGLRLIGQAAGLEDSLRESVQRCEDLKKMGDL